MPEQHWLARAARLSVIQRRLWEKLNFGFGPVPVSHRKEVNDKFAALCKDPSYEKLDVSWPWLALEVENFFLRTLINLQIF